MKEKKRIPTDGEPVQWNSPFAALKNFELPPTSPRDKTEGSAIVSPGPANRTSRRQDGDGRHGIFRYRSG